MSLAEWPLINGRIPGEVRWSHAVNNADKLERTLSSNVDMIESDIRISKQGEIIAAHPPDITGDLNFVTLLRKIRSSDKGLKLDFKDPEVIIPVLELLKKEPLSQPLLLNADILQGNGGSPSKWQPAAFVALSQRYYPDSILSLGWTTIADESKPYTSDQVDSMIELLTGIDTVSFPVRACLLPNSWHALQSLLEQNPLWTLTVWNNEPVDQNLAEWIHGHTDPARTFYDFIDDQKEPLHLW